MNHNPKCAKTVPRNTYAFDTKAVIRRLEDLLP